MMFDVSAAQQSLAKFFSDGKKISYQRKAIILGYDDDAQDAYLVVEGYVKVVSHSASGVERIHYLYGPGDFFPMSSLFGKTSFRVEFVAFTDVTTERKTMSEAVKFFESNPSALITIVNQQATTYSRIINLNMGNALRRVAYRILTLNQRFGTPMDDHSVIEIPITLQDLANMVRLTRESVGKVTADLERKGCMHMGRRNIIVYPEKLEQFSEE